MQEAMDESRIDRDEEAGSAFGWARRVLVAVAILVAAVVLGYLIGANWFLNSSWGKARLNRKPEKLSMSWERAWTVIPGLVHLTQFDLAGRARRATWETHMDSGRVWIWLPSLARRHMRVVSGSGRGVSVAVDTLPPPTTPRPERLRRGWRISLDRLQLDEIGRLRMNEYSLTGPGRILGGAFFEVRGPMRLDLGRLHFPEAQLAAGDAVVAESVVLDASLEVDEITIGETTVADLLAELSGEIELAARTSSLGFLAAYLEAFPWIRIGGAGDLALDLEVSHGWLAPGGSLTFTGPELAATYFGLRAEGSGSVTGGVPEDASHVRLEATLDRFGVVRPADGRRLLEGEGLRLALTNDSNAIDRPAEGIAVELELPPARVPEVAALSAYLPESLDLEIRGGSGEIEARLDYDSVEDLGSGSLVVSGKRIAAAFEDAAFVADARLEANMPEVRLRAGTLTLDATRLVVENATGTRSEDSDGEPWWARVGVPSGTLTKAFVGIDGEDKPAANPADARIDGRVDAELLDSSPLTAVLQGRVPRLGWFDRMLTVDNVRLESDLEIAGPAMRFEGLELSGGEHDRLAVHAELDLTQRDLDGVLLAIWGPLSAAVEVDDNARDWKLTRSKRWYEERAELYRRSRPSLD